jgi:WD40 repeat protein
MSIRCVQCHEPIDVTRDAGINDVDCPHCGARFDVVGDVTTEFEVSTAPRTGDQPVIGRFYLLRPLGAGAFGSVWLARDDELDRLVAVKIPHARLQGRQADRFLREARAAAQLHHPNIVAIHDAGSHDDVQFIVSDFVRGESLDEWRKKHRITPREAARLCAKIASALQHAHEAGVVHRDLKPANILIDEAGEPHVMDFGLAKRNEGEAVVTVEGAIVGSPAYMPPEQARGEGHLADARSDVYSIGVTFFQLLTGELPFRGNIRVVVRRILEDEPPKLRSLDNQVPVDLETICSKCLEKEPSKRYQTAGELAAELRRWLAGEPIEARPIGRPERFWRWCKRKPVIAGLAGIVAVLLMTVLAISFASYQGMSSQYDRIVEQNLEITKQNAAITEANAKLTAEEKVSRANLHRSLIEKARALLETKASNRRWTAMQALQEAAQIERTPERTPELRDEYLRCLTIPGFHTTCTISASTSHHFDFVWFTPNSHLLLASGKDGAIAEYDPRSGQPIRMLADPGTFLCGDNYEFGLAFSYNGCDFAARSATNAVTEVWSLQPRMERRGELCDEKGHAISARCLAFNRNGDLLAAAVELERLQYQICIYDASDLTLLEQWQVHLQVNDLAFVAGDQLLAASTNDDYVRRVILWQAGEWDESATFGATVSSYKTSVRPSYLSHSIDGRYLAVIGDSGSVEVWDLGQQKGDSKEAPVQVQNLHAHAGPVSSAEISPDGRWLMSYGVADQALKLWDVLSGELIGWQRISFRCSGMCWSPGGSQLALSTDEGTLLLELVQPFMRTYSLSKLADLTRGAPLAVQNAVERLQFDSEERWLACGTEALVDVADPEARVRWLPQGDSLEIARVMAFAPGGEIWIGSSRGSDTRLTRIRICDYMPLDEFESSDRGIRALVTGQDGRPIAAGLERRRELVVWDPTNLTTLVRCTPDRKMQANFDGKLLEYAVILQSDLQFNRDGRYLAQLDAEKDTVSGSVDHRIRLFNVLEGKELSTLRHLSALNCVAIANTGNWGAFGQGSTIIWFDRRDGQLLDHIDAHQAEIKDLAFDDSGTLLASIPDSGRQARLWAKGSAERLASFEIPGDAPLVRLALSASGRWLAIGDLNADVTIWDLTGIRQQLNSIDLDWERPLGILHK